jgi:hypothetical protein
MRVNGTKQFPANPLLDVHSQRDHGQFPHEADVYEPSEREKQAANFIKAKLKAIVDMQKVRKATVMPSEIGSFLKSHIENYKDEWGNKVDWRHLSHFIAREILEFQAEPVAFKGHGKRFTGDEEPARFPAFGHDNQRFGTASFKMPMSAWMSAKRDRKSIEIELIGTMIGEGSEKAVHRSKVLRVGLDGTSHPMTLEDMALVRQKIGVAKNDFLRGPQFLQGNFPLQSVDRDFRAAGRLTHKSRIVNGHIEARDTLFRGDLTDCSGRLTTKRRLKVLSDVASTLETIHAKNLVHGDVKLDNILVSRKERRGYLCDFDFAKSIGPNDVGTFEYVDAITLLGISTPFHDIYALAVSTAVMLFGAGIDYESSSALTNTIKQGFSEMSPERQAKLKALKDNLLKVIQENRETRQLLRTDVRLAQDLLKGQPEKQRFALKILYNRFPGFATFMRTLKECDASFK